MYQDTIDKINQSSPIKLFYAATGGGQSFISEYLQYGGASKTIVGCYVPYAKEQFDKFVAPVTIDKYCSKDAVLALATSAFKEALTSCDREYALGIGVSCSLATNNEREGRQHRAFIALQSQHLSAYAHLEFLPGMTRTEEEQLIVASVFSALEALIDTWGTTALINFKQSNCYNLTSDTISRAAFNTYEDVINDDTTLAIYPGSWNPLHEAHEQIADIVAEVLGVPVYHELAIVNADKGLLDYFEAERREEQFIKRDRNFIISDCPTFVDKVTAIRNYGYTGDIVFIVGYDTWERIKQSHYAGTEEELHNFFLAERVRFLVFPRLSQTPGNILNCQSILDNLSMYDKRILNYSNNISSSELRAKTIN